jgi:hypothetical protein
VKLIDYLKKQWNLTPTWNRSEMLKTLNTAKKELIADIQKQLNGDNEKLQKVYPIIKEFFGE